MWSCILVSGHQCARPHPREVYNYYIGVYNILTNRIRALKSTSEWPQTSGTALRTLVYVCLLGQTTYHKFQMSIFHESGMCMATWQLCRTCVFHPIPGLISCAGVDQEMGTAISYTECRMAEHFKESPRSLCAAVLQKSLLLATGSGVTTNYNC